MYFRMITSYQETFALACLSCFRVTGLDLTYIDIQIIFNGKSWQETRVKCELPDWNTHIPDIYLDKSEVMHFQEADFTAKCIYLH